MKNILVSLGQILRTRDFWIRVLFIAIASFFWLLLKLSKSGYVSTVDYPVVYENIPANKILIDAPTKHITLRVTSYGFRLLGYELRQENPLPLDVKRSVRRLYRDRNIYYWLPNLYREELQAQLDGQTTLLRLEPDTVFIVMSDKVRKKVPVVSRVKTSFTKGYSAYDGADVLPAEVTVAGPMLYIDTLTKVFTEEIEIKDIKKDQARDVKVIASNPMLSVTPAIVTYKLAVDQFTEKKILADVTMINVPKGEKVSIFPSKVELFFKVALRDYEQLTPETVNVICDFDQLLPNPSRSRLELDIKCTLKNASLQRASAHSVDFLRFKE